MLVIISINVTAGSCAKETTRREYKQGASGAGEVFCRIFSCLTQPGPLQAARQPPHLASWLFEARKKIIITKTRRKSRGGWWDLCRSASEAHTRPVPAAGPHGHEAGTRRGAPGLPHDPPSCPTPPQDPSRWHPPAPSPSGRTRGPGGALPPAASPAPLPQGAPPPFRDPPGRPLRPCRRCHLPWPSLCRPPVALRGGFPGPRWCWTGETKEKAMGGRREGRPLPPEGGRGWIPVRGTQRGSALWQRHGRNVLFSALNPCSSLYVARLVL